MLVRVWTTSSQLAADLLSFLLLRRDRTWCDRARRRKLHAPRLPQEQAVMLFTEK